MSHEDANRSMMMQVPDLGDYVRCLLPVRLTGGFTVTFGVWLEVGGEDLHRAFAAWWAPEYRDLVLEGRLANPIPVWGLLGAPAEARVHHEHQTPYLDRTTDPVLDRVLTEQWPHEAILDALPG